MDRIAKRLSALRTSALLLLERRKPAYPVVAPLAVTHRASMRDALALAAAARGLRAPRPCGPNPSAPYSNQASA